MLFYVSEKLQNDLNVQHEENGLIVEDPPNGCAASNTDGDKDPVTTQGSVDLEQATTKPPHIQRHTVLVDKGEGAAVELPLPHSNTKMLTRNEQIFKLHD